MTTNQRRLTACDKVVYKRHRMLVRQPLHDALLLTADIHGQDEEGVRQGGALSEDAQYIKMSVKTNSIGVR